MSHGVLVMRGNQTPVSNTIFAPRVPQNAIWPAPGRARPPAPAG
ncbi:uncharacterized protein AruCF_4518 [Achromobacter ruhlandii]|nr:uncharacterized protein AruCF_4518 [Achromobacter ruhlandii]